MPSRKKWNAEEIRLAAVAWIQAINDPAVPVEQKKLPFFLVAVIENLKKLEPNDHGSGRYHERGGKHVMDFLRDYVFKEVLKFNDALRIVHQATTKKTAASTETEEQQDGIMEQQKINMAVAIHRGLTTTMDYHFKNVDPLSWRFYTAWIELRNVPRFKFDPMNTAPIQLKTHNSSSSDGALRSEPTTATMTAANSASPFGMNNATVARVGPPAAVATGTSGPWGTSAGGSALGFQNSAASSTNMTNNSNNNNNLLAQFASFQEMLRREVSTTTAPMDSDQHQSMVSFYKRKLDEQIAESANLFQMAATYKRQLDEKDAMYKQQLDVKDAEIQSLKEQVSGLKKKKRKRTAETADGENAGAATAAVTAAASAGEAAASDDDDE
jgi:hypothetical protein